MHKYTIREIQLCERRILQVFVTLCEKHGLYYVLIGGTLLGAIRHKGFIPWDDDIDVMMPRPDYEKLMSLIREDKVDLLGRYKFSSYRDGTSVFPFLKLYDLKTEAREGLDTEKYLNAGAGSSHVWIDIFPMDGAPITLKRMQKKCGYISLLRRIFALSQAKLTEGKTKTHRLFKLFFGWIFKCISPSWISGIIDGYARQMPFSDSDYVACFVWGNGVRERVHRKGFVIAKKVEFEGMSVIAPSNFDEYLSSVYGDYMELPPIEKRVAHGADVYGE